MAVEVKTLTYQEYLAMPEMKRRYKTMSAERSEVRGRAFLK